MSLEPYHVVSITFLLHSGLPVAAPFGLSADSSGIALWFPGWIVISPEDHRAIVKLLTKVRALTSPDLCLLFGVGGNFLFPDSLRVQSF